MYLEKQTPCLMEIRARLIWSFFLLVPIAIAAPFGCGPTRKIPDTPTRQISEKKYVRGYIATRLRADNMQEGRKAKLNEFFLPSVEVELLRPATEESVSKIQTDLSGRFDFPPQEAGSYKLCWSRKGYVSECLPKPIIVGQRPVHVGTVYARVRADGDRSVSLYGSVTLRGGDVPRFLEPIVGVNAFAHIIVTDTEGKRLDRVLVNNFGNYVVPTVPAKRDGHLKVMAEVENGRTVRSIRGEKLISGPTHRVNVTMRNASPRIEDIVSSIGGVETRDAAPGELVRLEAKADDPNRDGILFSWASPRGSGKLSARTGQTVEWEAPAAPGLYHIYVQASDRNGGYDKKSVPIRVGAGSVSFSGRVVDTNGSPIEGAEAEIGGKREKTNAKGFFSLKVNKSTRYVLNIRKKGFALVSQIYRSGKRGGRWTMGPVTVVTLDPRKPMEVTDRSRQKAGCSVPFSAVVNWQAFGQRQLPRHQDGKGRTTRVGKRPLVSAISRKVIADRKERVCGPGTEIFIPAGSLVDGNGQPPPAGSKVNVSVGTVDLMGRDSMPGDYTAMTQTGQARWMESYGAGSIEVSQGSKSYQLRAGAKARLRIPVADVQLAAPGAIPAVIDRLTYNETTGIWEAEGTFTLDATGRFYVADISHFSTINVDVLKEGQSCVRFKSEGLPIPYNVEVVVPMEGGAAPRVRIEPIGENEKYFAIVNLPNDTDITLTPYSNDNIPYGVFTVNTNGPQTGDPTEPNYFECQTKVVLYEVEAPPPGSDAFLHGLYSFFATNVDEGVVDPTLGEQLEDATIDYYGTIDPRGLRKTLAEFKDVNNFVSSGDTTLQSSYALLDEVRASYANAIDLGFGRDMHGKRTVADDGDLDIAFYVSNYGDYDSLDEEDFELAVYQEPSELIATVAMEWSAIEDPPAIPYNYYDPDAGADLNDPDDPISISDPERVIKFFVYDKAGDPLFAADLDGRGDRPIPQLCMVCHGGAYNSGFNTGVPAFSTPADVKLGSVMLPFDVHGYVLEGAVPSDFEKVNQQLEFRQLNDMVVETEPGDVIIEIIDEMYLGASVTQLENFVVTGWDANDAHRDMYLNVIKTSCRVCHASRPLEDTGSGGTRDIRFQDVAQFTKVTGDGGIAVAADLRVCTQRTMPHALATYNRFWGSFDDSQPAIFPFQPSRLMAFFNGVVEPALAAAGEPSNLGTNCAPLADPDGDLTEPPVTLTLLQSEIFTTNCAVCHQSPPNFTNIDMDLRDSQTHGTTVGANAQELTSGVRIQPNSVANSYLYKKVDTSEVLNLLSCSGAPVADCGDHMPPPSGGLSPDDLKDLRAWINSGALDD
ncbi:MAG: carboxypeptidase-like regulatory domain-containing protein [Planctomycetota bacterium]|nr:carboxypeptidase-like regulatory domain-containing protein [Planctomycetota bacterium]